MSVVAIPLSWALTGILAHFAMAIHCAARDQRLAPDLDELGATILFWPALVYQYVARLKA